jgi:hypothetical protein
VAALALTAIMQFAFHRWVMYSRPELQSWPHWSVLLTALVLLGLSAWTNYKLVRKKMGEGEF